MLGTWPAEARDVALLLTSELVTNAVVHGAPPITLQVHLHDGSLRVEVADADPRAPRPSAGWSPEPEGGRGLLLVDALSTSWGTVADVTSGGKLSWFVLELRG